MKATNKQPVKTGTGIGKQRSYNEIIEFLDSNWKTNTNDTNLACMQKLDQAFGALSKNLNTILVAGTNGKSLTINFTTQLLRQEGLTVGSFYTPHVLTYNERISLNNEIIANKAFTEIANEVINTAEHTGLDPNSFEILTMMALIYFNNNNVDVAVLETNHEGCGRATTICSPKVTAITRVTTDDEKKVNAELKKYLVWYRLVHM